MKTIRVFHLTLMLFIMAFATSAFSAETKLDPLNTKAAQALYNPASNTIAGNPNGSVTLVELFDYNCSYCRKLQPVINKIIKENPDLRVVYKEYLLFGDVSLPATQAALAAQKQNKYLSLQNALLNAKNPLTTEEVLSIAKAQGLDAQKLKADMQDPALIQQIKDNNDLIASLGIDGAPVVIVTKTNIAKNPSENLKEPQYIRMGFDNAPKDIQAMIDRVKG